MIPVTELRIGNWISGQNDPNMKVIEISNGSVQLRFDGVDEDYGDWAYDDDDLRPVEITPEVLKRFGFEKATDSYGGWLSPEINDEQWRIRKDEFSYFWQQESSTNPVRFKGLHTLQNWFFMLSSNELEVKECDAREAK